ncbi:hypothetical protein WJX81_003838 [Elliptochloris bilobata]|uniref:Cytochrome b561 domain-containing protein n=1 Tax=Elliptochloris bilobata TaxID=381761 RepID=A0AAW1RUZ1_9CHLO
MMDHNVAGHVEILDDCTFSVTGFYYDGQAPAAHWWGGKGLQQDVLRRGIELNPMRLASAYTNAAMNVTLPANVTWNDLSVIAVWCEQFLADFGHIVLAKAGSLAPGTAPAMMDELAGFTHCIDLSPGLMQMHWKLDSNDPAAAQNATVLLRAVLPGDMWMGIGLSMDGVDTAMMIGSDAVVVGMVGDKCYAYSYFVTAKSQCNYQSGQNSGVCPVSGLLGAPGTNMGNTAQLLSCSRTKGDIVTVTFSRPLKAANKYQHDWPTGAAKPAVWALGPLSQGSNAAQPIILFHIPNNAGPTFAGPDFKLSFGNNSQCATPLTVQSIAAAKAAQAPAAPPVRAPPMLLDMSTNNGTAFLVTVGSNKNYPNPPGWGLSYHLNGFETPVVRVVRGRTYHFTVMAGETHPLYITDTIIGGGDDTDVIFAGGENNFGTQLMPSNFTWTPNATTPDMVFYQCLMHKKLGWLIQVVNPDGKPANLPNSNKATTTGLQSLSQAVINPTLIAGAPGPAAAPLDCSVAYAGGPSKTYSHCQTLSPGDASVRLYWTLDRAASAIDGLLQCDNGDTGWVELKYSAINVDRAVANNTYLAAQTPTGIQLDAGRLALSSLEAAKSGGKTLQSRFWLAVPPGADNSYKLGCIVANGPLAGNGMVAQHGPGSTLGASVNLASGGVEIAAVDDRPFVAHGVLMVVAWVFILPISVAVARTCKGFRTPLWFHVHRVLGVLALAMALAGLGLGIWLWQATGYGSTGVLVAHVALGLIIVGLGLLQGLALAMRPNPKHRLRWAWNLYHHWVGRIALLGAFANAMLGFALGQLPAWYSWGLAIIWAAIWMAAGAKMLANVRHARRSSDLCDVPHARGEEQFMASGAFKGAAAEV